MSEDPICLTITPGEYFKDLIGEAQVKSGISLKEEMEFYLVTLLTDFIYKSHDTSTPLALLLKESMESDPEKRMRILKLLGDQSLYFAGFFQDSFNRKAIDIDYFIRMGAGAYASLAEIHENRQSSTTDLPGLYHNLSLSFSDAVEIIAHVSEKSMGQSTTNLLAIYERWSKSPSSRLLKKLMENGIDPIISNMKTAN